MARQNAGFVASMGVTPEQGAVVDVVRREFGAPRSIRFAETWGPRVVLEAALSGRTVFVKATADADVQAEAAAIALARSAGVAAPEVLGAGTDPRVPGGRWIAMAKAAGIRWSIDQPVDNARTVRDIASSFARLHSRQVPGFGPLSAEGVGTYGSWGDWLRETLDEYLDSLARSGLATQGFREKARSVFAIACPSIPQGSLVHGDLGDGETFVDPDSGAVTCLVDWGGTIVGDPVYELARFVAGGPADDPRPPALLPMLIEQYTAEAGIERSRVERTLPLYHVHNAVLNAEWSRREDLPWIPGLLAKADAILDRYAHG